MKLLDVGESSRNFPVLCRTSWYHWAKYDAKQACLVSTFVNRCP